MKQIHKDRLLKLAEHLENYVERKNWNLDVVIENLDGSIDPNTTFKNLKQKTCGTAACACGHLPVVFPRSFMYAADDPDPAYAHYITVQSKNPDVGLRDLELAGEFFGLNNDLIDYLFTPQAYSTDHRGPKSVARRIRSLVNQNGKVKMNTRAFRCEFFG